MGWFRGRRKRREAGTAGLRRRALDRGRPPKARRARRAVEQEPTAGLRTAVPDPIPWRHLEGGGYQRLLGPLADDEGVSALLDYWSPNAPWETTTARP